VAQWLRCCATNGKVTGLIPAGVSGFFIDIKSFRSHCGPGVDSASKRNEYQEHFLGVRLTTLPPSCVTVTKSGNLTSWNPLGHSRPVMRLLYLYLYFWKIMNVYFLHFILCVHLATALTIKNVIGISRYIPVTFMWVVALHSLFLYLDPPQPCHPPSDWLRLFLSQTFSHIYRVRQKNVYTL